MFKPLDNNLISNLVSNAVNEYKNKKSYSRSQTPYLISNYSTLNNSNFHHKSSILQSTNIENTPYIKSINEEVKPRHKKSNSLFKKSTLNAITDKIRQNPFVVQGFRHELDKSRIQEKKQIQKFIFHRKTNSKFLTHNNSGLSELSANKNPNISFKKHNQEYFFPNFEIENLQTVQYERTESLRILNSRSLICKTVQPQKDDDSKRFEISIELTSNMPLEPNTIEEEEKVISLLNPRNFRSTQRNSINASENTDIRIKKRYHLPLLNKEQKLYIENRENEIVVKLRMLQKYLFNSKIEEMNRNLFSSPPIDIQFAEKNKTIKILLSIYLYRPATIFFGNDGNNSISNTKYKNILYYNTRDNAIPYFQCESETIFVIMTKNGFVQTEKNDWTLFWGRLQPPEFIDKLGPKQRINHYPGSKNLGRKDYLWKNYTRMRMKFPQEYNYMPQTYILDNDYNIFQSRLQQANNGSIWIMKPVASSCGRGIKIINKYTKINPKKGYLVSDYIQNPHLMNGIKYDLRIYVGLTSLDPLRIYIYQEGLVRFATEKYSLRQSKLNDRFGHLTNFSINKNSDHYAMNNAGIDDRSGSKWSLKSLRMKFEELNIDYDEIFGKIKDIIIKTLISVESMMFIGALRTQENVRKCFELYGFDILIDQNYKPWLMEVNISPSLNLSSPLDYQIKMNLLQDILNLVNLKFYKDYNDKYEKAQSPFFKSKEKNIKSLNELNWDNCILLLNYEEWRVLLESEEELARSGAFELIFPLRENIEFYRKFFEVDKYFNILLWNSKLSERNYLDKFCNKR